MKFEIHSQVLPVLLELEQPFSKSRVYYKFIGRKLGLRSRENIALSRAGVLGLHSSLLLIESEEEE